MTVRIVTDSTCDLPSDVISQYRIHVVPLYINIGKQGYLDGIDISREEFYDKLPFFSEQPTTAVPSIQRFISAYDAMADEGASDVLSIHISKSLSAVVDVAQLAAQETTSTHVTVIDSGQLSLGTGFLVEKAAEMASAGHSAQEIIAVLKDQMERSHVFAALDTLEFLKRSGRMNKYAAGIAGLLQIKPILIMHSGKPGSERVRTRDRAYRRVIELLQALNPFEKIAIVHAHAHPEQIAKIRSLAGSLLPNGPIITQDITPVIGAHIGPGAIGFAVVRSVG